MRPITIEVRIQEGRRRKNRVRRVGILSGTHEGPLSLKKGETLARLGRQTMLKALLAFWGTIPHEDA